MSIDNSISTNTNKRLYINVDNNYIGDWYFDCVVEIASFNYVVKYINRYLSSKHNRSRYNSTRIIKHIHRIDSLYRKCLHLLKTWKSEYVVSRSASRKRYYKRLILKSRAADCIKFIDKYVYGIGSISWTKANADGSRMSVVLMYRKLVAYMKSGFDGVSVNDKGVIRLIPKKVLDIDGVRPLSYPSHSRKFSEYLLYGRVYDEKLFDKSSWGFQIQKNAGKCVKEILSYMCSGYNLIWNADLSDAFGGMDRDWIRTCLIRDGINHREVSLLMKCLDVRYKVSFNVNSLKGNVVSNGLSAIHKEVNKLVETDLKKLKGKVETYNDKWCDVLNNYTFEYDNKIHYIKKLLKDGTIVWNSICLDNGTPQGGVNSPMLFNIGLEILHRMIHSKFGKRIQLVRYADDYVIMSKSGRDLRAARRFVSKFLNNKAKLEVNRTKSYFSKGTCDFLGYTVEASAIYPNIKELLSSIKNKINPKLRKLVTCSVTAARNYYTKEEGFRQDEFIKYLLGIGKDMTIGEDDVFSKTEMFDKRDYSDKKLREMSFANIYTNGIPPIGAAFYNCLVILARVLNGEFGIDAKGRLMDILGVARNRYDNSYNWWYCDSVLLGVLNYYLSGLGFKSKNTWECKFSSFENITSLKEADLETDIYYSIPYRWRKNKSVNRISG